MKILKSWLLSPLFHPVLIGLLVVNFALLGVYLYAQRPTAPTPSGLARAGQVVMLPPSIPVPPSMAQAVAEMLNQKAPQLGVFRFAITSIGQQAGYTLVSVAGFPLDQPEKWNLDQAVWLGSVTLAPAGLAAGVVDSPASAPEGGGAGDIMPFAGGTTAMYGELGSHDCGFSLNGWKAVDLFPSNGDVYTASAGEVSYVCRDSTQMSVRIGNKMYVHLVDTGVQIGSQFSQGQKISSVVRGTFNDTCGNASQNAENGHVHFCFQPEASGLSYSNDGYTLSLVNNSWVGHDTTVNPTGYLTAYWTNANVTPPPSAVGSNLWDGLAFGIDQLARGSAADLPVHTQMGLAQRVLGIAAIPLKLVYSVILVNFNMTVFIWCFGIILGLETARLAYSAYMWVKRAIPVIG